MEGKREKQRMHYGKEQGKRQRERKGKDGRSKKIFYFKMELKKIVRATNGSSRGHHTKARG